MNREVFGFLYCVLNTESPLREVLLCYCANFLENIKDKENSGLSVTLATSEQHSHYIIIVHRHPALV